ncbi:MAG: NADH-quinone oxidoreductase subunit A [Candidatus Methanomethylicia archaeon]|jgi:NADH:ubiquinone oxidoreductase subunit 3 (subunit A)|nr:NADH-quinone oxidoreductase subunit A [Candidatus Methanomethylicia archaeon]
MNIISAIVIALLIVLSIFFIGRKFSQKQKYDKEKFLPYACGEDLPVEEVRINLEKFLIFALYFLIFDVITYIIAVSFFERGILPAIYSIIALASVLVLIFGGWHK